MSKNVNCEEKELLNDPKYRVFAQQVDKALKAFEDTSRWPDLVYALSRLIKVLDNNNKYQVIPQRLLISQRLAQCMHPELPTGVHFKAIETFDLIFRSIGSDKLIQELSIYSNGLFPLLSQAAINVKPELLKIFQNHFIPLGQKLRPALDGFLITLLLGLDEDLENQGTTYSLLQNLCDGVGREFFYGALWRCVLIDSSIRLPAITFVTSHFVKKQNLKDQLYITGTNLNTFIRGICASLLDEDFLVQRAVLDLLLDYFPIHNCSILNSDMINITTAAITVFLRRDISLNRRLESWLFGINSASQGFANSSNKSDKKKLTHSHRNRKRREVYFTTYSCDLVLQAVIVCLGNPSKVIPIPQAWSSLGDKWSYSLLTCLLNYDICQPILDSLCIHILRSLYFDFKLVSSPSDLIKTFNLLLSNLKVSYFWKRLNDLLSKTCEENVYLKNPSNNSDYVQSVGVSTSNVCEILTLMQFMVETTSVDNFPETKSFCYPFALNHVLNCLIVNCYHLNCEELSIAIQVCFKLVSKIELNNHLEANKISLNQKELSDIKEETDSLINSEVSFKTLSKEKTEVKNVSMQKEDNSDSEFFTDKLIFFIQKLFNVFVHTRLVKDESFINSYFDQYLLNQKSLENLNLFPTLNLNSEMISVYCHLCQLLVKTALITDVMKEKRSTAVIQSHSSSENFLKPWLIDLLVLSCFVNQVYIRIIYCSISTFIDLFTIIRSQLFNIPLLPSLINFSPSGSLILDLNFEPKKKCLSNILIENLISLEILNFIANQTNFFYKITTILWNNLKEEFSGIHLETAILLQNIHHIAPESSICESVIIFAMGSSDETVSYEARKRFSSLFSITRDLKQKFSLFANMREFDRPLFFMLDSLFHKIDSHNAQAFDWLSQCLKYGDIGRILEPLLFILLHPDTNRVSIQNVNISQSPELTSSFELNRCDEADNAAIAAAEAKIFAISSAGGNLIYHVYPEGKKKISNSASALKTSNFTFPNQSSLRSLSSNKPMSSKFNFFDNDFSLNSDQACNEQKNPLSMNMFINPFGSLSSLINENFETFDTLTQISDVLKPKKKISKTLIEQSSNISLFSQSNKLNFNCESDFEIISNLLDEIIDAVSSKMEEDDNESVSSSSEATTKQNISESVSLKNRFKPFSVSHLHSHILLYTQVYDSQRTFFALNTLLNIILTDPQNVLFKMATTSICNRIGNRSQELHNLCIRHAKSISGQTFYGEIDPELSTNFKNNSFLEIIITTCLSYIRSFYPNLPQSRLNNDEVQGNQKVRILSCDILCLIFSELITTTKRVSTLSSYLNEILTRTKSQKIILHSIVSSVYGFQYKSNQSPDLNKETNDVDLFPDIIINFNEKLGFSGFQEDMQKSLLKLLEQLMILENKVAPNENQTEKNIAYQNKRELDSRAAKIRFQPRMSSLKYCPNILIPSQSMFLSAIQTALQQSHKSFLHSNWLSLVEATLPYAGYSLTRLIVCVINQLCHNLENIALQIKQFVNSNSTTAEIMTPNYLLIILKGMSVICHYCLIDTHSNNLKLNSILSFSQNSSSSSSLNSTFLPSTAPTANTNSSSGPLQVITNLLNVFSNVDGLSYISQHRENSKNHNDPLASSRSIILSHLPQVLSSLLSIWKVITIFETSNKKNIQPGWQIMGTAKDIKKYILEFLSPISLLHGPNFLGAVAIVWCDLRDPKSSKENRRNVVPKISSNQSLLVELIFSIKVLPMESVFVTVRQVIKSPPASIYPGKKQVSLEVNILQFLLAYIRMFPGSQLIDCWKSLLTLLREVLNVSSYSPMAQFHLLAILHEFVQATPLFEDRKDQKDLQDVAQRIVEACTNVAAARLAQTKWLRKNLEVKPGPQNDEVDEIDEDFKEISVKMDTTSLTFDSSPNDENFLSKYSVQALNALAQFVAPVLDVIYVSEEKEKVVPLVSNIIFYVTPYLKNHSKNNFPSFRACSHLLASISGYQYSRKAWKKEAFELLLDNSFFQMEPECLSYWKTIIDHLMTHDKTSFRDFLSRMVVNQSGSLKIFSSKDQESEQRAQLAKRLAFILFCNEKDQYQKYMPEIQEKLIEALRVNSSPILQSNILLCFRVLIMRMSSHNLTSLWPFIYTEMCQVFLQIELKLNSESSETNLLRFGSTDSSSTSNNGLSNSSNQNGYLKLYLQTCKLLDLALTLSTDLLPQFQMYRWAFISQPCDTFENNSSEHTSCIEKSLTESNESTSVFEPIIVRIEKMMRAKNSEPQLLNYSPKHPLITFTSIGSLMDLHSFFYTLIKHSSSHQYDRNNFSQTDEMYIIDKIFEMDFLEPV